uniref:Uncharacterized protein n=1 Tax=Sinocyclocheilus anshuiensis TaxID=1608454 RepID=A0A671QK44_9TELE
MFLEQANQISGLRNDLLTPAVRFNPCVTPFPGPSPPMESSESCLGFTTPSELVFLIPNFLFFHISEEKSHHPLEELVHELNDFSERRGQLYV